MIENYIYSALSSMLRETETDRLESFQRRREAYVSGGEKPLKTDGGGFDDSVRMNYARMIVDKGVAFLFGKDVRFELAEGDVTPQEEWLDAVWMANRKMSLLQKLATNGGIYGTAFLKIHAQPGQMPKLVVVDPETVSVALDPMDVDSVLRYTIRYQTLDPQTNKIISVRQVIAQDGLQWQITDEIGNVGGGTWQTVSVQTWPYRFAPMLHCQNLNAPNAFWGVSDIEDDVLEVINKESYTVSNILKILRFHAHPKTWVRGASAAQIKVNPDNMIVLPGETATIQNLEMQSDLASSIAMHRELVQFIHGLSRIPEVSTGRLDNVGALSGVALEILYQPLLEKTEAKRMTYGEMLVELNRRLLAIGGFGDENYTELRWQDLLPKDAVAEANAALSLKQLGVSSDTLVQQFGYDPDLEREKRAKESDLGQALLQAFDRGEAQAE